MTYFLVFVGGIATCFLLSYIVYKLSDCGYVEKQKPKELIKRKYVTFDSNEEATDYICPQCGKVIESRIGNPVFYPNYCSNCGQALDWSE